MRLITLLLTFTLFLCGCRTAEDAFLDAQNAEASGNNSLAVRYYLETIRLKPDMIQAKERLAVVGQKEIDSRTRQAESLVRNGRGLDALSQIDSIETMFRQVRIHAPSVKKPGNLNLLRDQAQTIIRSDLFRKVRSARQNGEWDQALTYLTDIERYSPTAKDREQMLSIREDVNNQAFKQYTTLAENQFDNGKYSESLKSLERAEKYADKLDEENLLNERKAKYRNNIIISEAKRLKGHLDKKQYIKAQEQLKRLEDLKGQFQKSQLDALRVLNIKLYNTWANDLFNQGKYRESWHRAADALKFESNNQEALQIQDKALKLGRTTFALLPIIKNRNSVNLANQIDTDFNNGPARNMPPFTALVPEFDLRDAFRAFRVNPQNITREQALAVARRTKSQFVIFREITGYRLEEQFTSSKNVAVKKVDNSQGAMEIKKGQLKLNAQLLITIVDARSGHRVFGKECDISSTLEFEQAFLDGPEKNYILNNQQRSLLNPPGDQDITALEKSSAKTATDFFLKTVFPEMEKMVP